MKLSSERSTAKARKGASQVAAAATLVKDTLTTARSKVRGTPGKAVTVKTVTNGKHERHANLFVAFTGSGVMAHDVVVRGVSGRR